VQIGNVRIGHLVLLFVSITFVSGCDYFFEEGMGNWDCDHPHWIALTILNHRMILQTDKGNLQVAGYWKNDAFWCPNATGGNDFAAAKVLPEDQLAVQAKVFTPGTNETVIFNKIGPGYAEAKQLAQDNQGPVTYPPPKGAIAVGITEYRLNMLRWKPISVGLDENNVPQNYQFPSNDPTKPPLTVTVQNHRVISVNGGNE